MKNVMTRGLTRRQFVKTAAATGLLAGVGANIIPRRAKAAKKLTILQWQHFVPAYDKWFNETWIKDWGAKNDTEVTVDNINNPLIPARMAAEASAKQGHDLIMSLQPPPVYEELVIDHKDIYAEVEKKWGKAIPLAYKSSYNPKTKKYYGFSDMYVPDPINYNKPMWDEVGILPDSWDNILKGGRLIKKKRGVPVGIGLSNELDTAMAIRALMYSNGAAEQTADGKLALKSKAMLDCIKYMKALYQDTMTPEVLAWDPSSNNRAMLAGTISLALNAISITRTAEVQKMPISKDIWLLRSAKGKLKKNLGLEHVMSVYTIWEFAQNKDGAQKFLVDLVNNFPEAFKASAFYNFPTFRKTVPNIQELVKKDAIGEPADKYAILADSVNWSMNVGFPGYANAAVGELWNTWTLNTMFAKAATGEMTPEDALDQANKAAEGMWAKWKEKGLI